MAVDRARISSGDAAADGADPAKLLDTEMDQLAGLISLIAAHGFRLQGAQFVQAQPPQSTADSCGRDTGLEGDLLARPAPATQPFDCLDGRPRRRPAQPMRARRAIPQSRRSFAAISVDPFANRPRADACGFGDGLRRLPALDLPYIRSRPSGVSRAFLWMFIRSSENH